MKETIGFIGQGFIGKHMADDFVARDYDVVRYALEPAYVDNRAAIADCEIVFVAVPTPTTPAGFDDHMLRDALDVPALGSIVVIKSTVAPGTTKVLQQDFPELTLLHAPEFLREKSAAADTAKPERTIIGLPEQSSQHTAAAATVLAVLPKAPYELVCDSTEAELIKYGGNSFLALKVVFMNLLYNLAAANEVSYDTIAAAMVADPRIGNSHMQVLDSSGHPGAPVGRGAGGHCFPKDMEVLQRVYAAACPEDAMGVDLLRQIIATNNQLLRDSGKDLDLLESIYGTHD